MSAPVLIGPAEPTVQQFNVMRHKRDLYALVIARDVVRGFEPDAVTRERFALLDGATRTASASFMAGYR